MAENNTGDVPAFAAYARAEGSSQRSHRTEGGCCHTVTGAIKVESRGEGGVRSGLQADTEASVRASGVWEALAHNLGGRAVQAEAKQCEPGTSEELTGG